MNRSITINMVTVLGPVVPSIVRLKSSLRGQHLKCFFLLYNLKHANIFVEKKERSFCNPKASHIFSTKNIGVFQVSWC